MARKMEQPIEVSAGETEVVSINCTRHLDSAELLTGTVTVSELRTSAVAPSGPFVNTATYEESKTGDTVAIGKAIQFVIAPTKKGNYIIRFSVGTTSTPSRTIVRDIDVKVL